MSYVRTDTTAATLAHIFPGLHTASLISLRQLCDSNYRLVLDSDYIFIVKMVKLSLLVTGTDQLVYWIFLYHNIIAYHLQFYHITKSKKRIQVA